MLRNVLRTLSGTWVIATVTVVICAFFVARAVSSIIAAETLTEDPTPPVPVAAPAEPILASRVKVDGTKIDRNIFCSDCEPSIATTPVADRYTGEPAVLIATMIGREPRAIVRVLASEAQGSWGIGERIPGVGMIDRIGNTSIDVVDVAGHRGTISLLDSQAAGQPKHVDAATSAPAAPADPFADSVRKIAENDYEVERSLVRGLVTGTTKAGTVRAMPVMKGGEIQGIRLSGVRAGTIPTALGLKNGDTISAIDGDQIKNVQQLLDLYAKLDNVSAVELNVTRGGKPFNLTLRLR